MALRPDQKDCLLQLRRQLLESLAVLLQERCVVQSLLKASLQSSVHARLYHKHVCLAKHFIIPLSMLRDYAGIAARWSTIQSAVEVIMMGCHTSCKLHSHV